METTRRWPTAEQMAEKMMVQLETERPLVIAAVRGALKARLAAWYRSGGFSQERKISRLMEKLKDALEAGAYGPLFETDPETGEADPARPTSVGRVWQDMRSIYTLGVLYAVDEEGELLS